MIYCPKVEGEDETHHWRGCSSAVGSAPALGCTQRQQHEHLLLMLPLQAPCQPLGRGARVAAGLGMAQAGHLHYQRLPCWPGEQRVGCSRSREPAGGFGEGAEQREAWSGGKREGGNL